MPSSIAAITRWRRSVLRLLVITTSWQITSSSESDKTYHVNPKNDSAFTEDALEESFGVNLSTHVWAIFVVANMSFFIYVPECQKLPIVSSLRHSFRSQPLRDLEKSICIGNPA